MVKYRFYYEIIVSKALDNSYVTSYVLKININDAYSYHLFSVDVFCDYYSISTISKYRVDFILNVLFGKDKKNLYKFILDLNKAIKNLFYNIPQQDGVIKNFYYQKSKINRYIKEHYI